MKQELLNKIATDYLLKHGFSLDRIKASLAECDNSYMPLTDIDLEMFKALERCADAYQFNLADFLINYQINE